MMAYRETKIQDKVSPGIASTMKIFEQERPEAHFLQELCAQIDEKKILGKLERDLNMEDTGKPLDKASIRKKHNNYIQSQFDVCVDHNELRDKHEENKKLSIDAYIGENPIQDEEKTDMIRIFSDELDSDFEALLVIYKIKKKNFDSEHKQALEIARKFYVQEMDKLFVEKKFITSIELEDLHEKYKSLSHNKLREQLPLKQKIIGLSLQLNQSLEIIYDQYKRQNITYIPLKPAIGIDLGTTYCCVGVINRGKVHIVTNTYGLNTTPSYVSFEEDGEAYVGSSAKESSFRNPSCTIYDAKRMIGRKFNNKHIQNDMKFWPFEVIDENDSLKIKLRSDDNITLYPEEISAKILSKLKSDAENFLGYKVKDAVITVPAYFNDAQRQATKDAGLLAGLNVLQILNEPTAAAIAYSHQIKDDFSKNILIYDLGGGTFDVAVAVIENGDIDIRAVSGDPHLGGNDFDLRILNFLVSEFKDHFSEEFTEDVINRAKARLKYHCENKKWNLSEVNSVDIAIDLLLPDWDFKFTLTQSKFEELCIDLFNKTIKIMDETLKHAKIDASHIDDIVLIGGSTKIPKIQKLLKEYFTNKSLNKELIPDEAVAYGATVQASLLNGQKLIDSSLAFIHDVSPFSLGVEVEEGKMAFIIPRNSKIPISKTQTFYTGLDDQTYVYIQIFEGEHLIAKQNNLLGVFVIDGLPKNPARTEKVEVTFEIDREGILHVKGVTSSGSANLSVKDHRGRIPPEKLKILIKAYNG